MVTTCDPISGLATAEKHTPPSADHQTTPAEVQDLRNNDNERN